MHLYFILIFSIFLFFFFFFSSFRANLISDGNLMHNNNEEMEGIKEWKENIASNAQMRLYTNSQNHWNCCVPSDHLRYKMATTLSCRWARIIPSCIGIFSSTMNSKLKHNYEFEKCSLINCIKTFFCVWFFLNANRCFKYLPKWLYTILNIMDVYFVCSSRQLTTKNNNLHKPELRAHGQEPHVLLQHCHCSGCMCQITNTQYLSIEKWNSSHWKPFVCVTMSSSRFPLNPVKSSVSLFYIPQPLHNERCHRGKFKHCQNIKRSAAPLQIQPLFSSEMWYSLLL